MNRKNSRWTAALAATLLVQIAAFAWLIVRYERVASGGTVCRFACEAYDPSDPFRGRYLHIRVRERVDYDAAFRLGGVRHPYRLFPASIRIDPAGGSNGLSRVTACGLEPQGPGLWATGVKARARYRNYSGKDDPPDYFEVQLPDQFFLNERLADEEGRLFTLSRTNSVAVYRVRDGRMVLSDIEIDGTPLNEYIRKRRAHP